jgi:polysaccharide pyruvyl transferase WcaK-like protein
VLRQAGFGGQLVAAGDLAGLLPEALGEQLPPVARPSYGVRPRLGVTLLGVDYESAGREAQLREDVLIEGIRDFVQKEAVDVTVFVFNTHPVHGDVRVSERLRAAVEGLCDVRVVTAADGVRATWQAMKECQLGLHMRLHGAIFSYVAGVPFALVPYQPKCDHLLDELGQPAGLRLGRVPDHPDAVVRALAAILDTNQMPALDREEFAHRARINFTAAPWAVRG